MKVHLLRILLVIAVSMMPSILYGAQENQEQEEANQRINRIVYSAEVADQGFKKLINTINQTDSLAELKNQYDLDSLCAHEGYMDFVNGKSPLCVLPGKPYTRQLNLVAMLKVYYDQLPQKFLKYLRDNGVLAIKVPKEYTPFGFEHERILLYNRMARWDAALLAHSFFDKAYTLYLAGKLTNLKTDEIKKEYDALSTADPRKFNFDHDKCVGDEWLKTHGQLAPDQSTTVAEKWLNQSGWKFNI